MDGRVDIEDHQPGREWRHRVVQVLVPGLLVESARRERDDGGVRAHGVVHDGTTSKSRRGEQQAGAAIRRGTDQLHGTRPRQDAAAEVSGPP